MASLVITSFGGAVMALSRSDPEKLASYVRSLPDFEIYTQINSSYEHIGATLADAVLHANSNHKRNVPRMRF